MIQKIKESSLLKILLITCFYLLIFYFVMIINTFSSLKLEKLYREKEKECISYYIDNDGYTLDKCDEYVKKLEEFK